MFGLRPVCGAGFDTRKVVEDPVAASGWCQLFQAKPA